jgi:hypothetical protein
MAATRGAISSCQRALTGILLHGFAGLLKVIRLQIADQKPVLVQKQRVVAPSGLAQRFLHLRPHLGMALFVLLQFFRANMEQKADTHSFSLCE